MFNQTHLNNQRGFSLVELAIVVAILGFVFLGFSSTFSSFHHNQELEDVKSNTANVKKQLLSFAVVNKYLPCPDTDADGYENRTLAANGFEVCTNNVGTVPFTDIGLEEQQVRDSWSNPFRYVVNSRTSLENFICDKRQLSSYFCNAAAGATAWFTISDTPPFTGQPGARSITVCNEDEAAGQCSLASPSAETITNSAVAVVVAFNRDGAQTINNCAGMNAASAENCDDDEFFHQARGSNEAAFFFDDVIVSLTGQEVKSTVLAPVVAWSSFNPPPIVSPLTPTYTSFDIDGTDNTIMKNGVAEFSDKADEPDTVLINRDVTTGVDLGKGDDYIAIGNDFNAGSAELIAGDGDDTVYIVGDALSDISLGKGDDTFVLAYLDPADYPYASIDNGDLKAVLDAGPGNDMVWIQGEIASTASLDLGTGNDILWLGKNTAYYDNGVYVYPHYDGNIVESTVTASGNADDYDIVVIETIQNRTYLSTTDLNALSDFDLLIFAEDAAGNREYCVMGAADATGC